MCSNLQIPYLPLRKSELHFTARGQTSNLAIDNLHEETLRGLRVSGKSNAVDISAAKTLSTTSTPPPPPRMASNSVCFTSSLRPHLRPTSFFLLAKPAATPKPVKVALLSTKIPSFHGIRLVNSWVRGGGVVARAGDDFDEVEPGPGDTVESDDQLLSDVMKKVMDAVDAFGGKVTTEDVESMAGLMLDEAQKVLQALASDTDGLLEVTDEGDVPNVFPKKFASKLAAKSFQMKIEPLIKKGKSAAKQVIRVTFGAALIASVVIAYATILALLKNRRD